MKKIIIALFSAILLAGCGVGSYSVSSGRSDEAAISFTSSSRHAIIVVVDGTEYNVETVKTSAYKADRNIKKTASNTIKVQPGQHELKVISSGKEIYNKKVFISTSEHRIVEL